MSKKTGKIIKCDNCGKEHYKPGAKIKRSNNLFCSKKCFDVYRLNRVVVVCQNCGKKINRVPSHANRGGKYIVCGRECLSKLWEGKNHSGFFKVGNRLDKCINFKDGKQECNGYIAVLRPDHPHCNSRGYVYEHRLVMESSVGRYLTKEEVVHHIDFNKQNNNINNLMLFKNDKEHRQYHATL